MIEEQAIVVNIEKISNINVDTRQRVTVTSEVKSACGSCKQVDNCGTGQISKALPQKALSLTVMSDVPVKLGDKVIIGILEKPLFQTAWQVYLLPLIGLFLFSGIGQLISEYFSINHEFFTIFSGIIGGYLGYKLAQKIQQNKEKCNQLEATLLRVV